MLVLSRKINQSVMIGDDIEIILLETKGDSAKIGIVAPAGIKVFRQEIYLSIKAENQKSSHSESVEKASSLLKQAMKNKRP